MARQLDNQALRDPSLRRDVHTQRGTESTAEPDSRNAPFHTIFSERFVRAAVSGRSRLPRVGNAFQAGFGSQRRLPDHGVNLPTAPPIAILSQPGTGCLPGQMLLASAQAPCVLAGAARDFHYPGSNGCRVRRVHPPIRPRRQVILSAAPRRLWQHGVGGNRSFGTLLVHVRSSRPTPAGPRCVAGTRRVGFDRRQSGDQGSPGFEEDAQSHGKHGRMPRHRGDDFVVSDRHLAQPGDIGGPFLKFCQVELIQADPAGQGGQSTVADQFDRETRIDARRRSRSRGSLAHVNAYKQ